MPVYNLLGCSSDYFDKAGSLIFYFKDEANNFDTNFENTNAIRSFGYKTKLLWDTVAQLPQIITIEFSKQQQMPYH